VEKSERDRRYPKPLIDKTGIQPEHKVHVDGVDDAPFWAELRRRTDDVSTGRLRKRLNAIIYGVHSVGALAKLERLRESIEDDGMIWVVWPKGKRELNEDHVREAALAVGLVDVKVVAFSETLSALKLVVPVAKRSLRAPGSRTARS
jgi:hypothetical protein